VQSALTERDIRPAANAMPMLSRKSPGIITGSALGRIGPLEVRLARDAAEIAASQEVRYRVFYEELGAKRQLVHALEQRDADRYDEACDHLLVFDTSVPGPDTNRIVGTYRLLRQERTDITGGFYSNDEFELDSLVARHPGLRFLELGRSCVLPAYRSKRTIEVLWQGIWAYINHYEIGVMTGCASFHGTVPVQHAEALSYLAHHCRPDAHWDVRAVEDRYHPMDLMPVEALSMRSAFAAMPPLIKGYLRVGAKIGDGCVIDHDFGTTDVFIVLPVAAIGARYVNYLTTEAERFAA
jgi:L-ornithine Nalpha-acyltransferase